MESSLEDNLPGENSCSEDKVRGFTTQESGGCDRLDVILHPLHVVSLPRLARASQYSNRAAPLGPDRGESWRGGLA